VARGTGARGRTRTHSRTRRVATLRARPPTAAVGNLRGLPTVPRDSCRPPQAVHCTDPQIELVPTGWHWGRQIFIDLFTSRQVLEKRRSYRGSTKSISVERDSFREEQLLQSLFVVERRLHPQVRGTRQNALRKRQDAFHVKFVDCLGVVVAGTAGNRASGLVRGRRVGSQGQGARLEDAPLPVETSRRDSSRGRPPASG
jgi:hypothetical protein